MRDVAIDRSSRSRRRMVYGTVVTGVGAALIGAGLFGGAGLGPVGLGALLLFVGVAVLGPILARPMSRVIGAPLPRLKGTSGALARQNAMRNPKRTSATAAALMIGVALVGVITILASSTKASLIKGVDRNFNGDLVIASNIEGDGGLSPQLAEELATLPELGAVTGFRMAPVEVDGHGTNLISADVAAIQQIMNIDVTQGSFNDLHDSEIAIFDEVAAENGWELGDMVPVRFAETGVQQLRLVAITDNDPLGEYFVSLEVYDANMADYFDRQVLVSVAEGVSIDQATKAIENAIASNPLAEVQSRDEFIEAQTANMDTILNLIYALLALAVFIALLGIANTLALSIFERTRELGLLRAVGMTRRQLRTTVRYESVIIALIGTTLGLVIGTALGWAIVKALASEGLDTFSIPFTQLAVVTAIAALAGVAAAALPARRAAGLDVLQAITTE